MGNTTFDKHILDFYFQLTDDLELPSGVESIFPFRNTETRRVMQLFYQKYYKDYNGRNFIFGINPGRFGSGITGIGFSDSIGLEKHCGIPNDFKKRAETSAEFIFEVINAYGGPDVFYQDFYITATSPIGFIKDGKNFNYYDDKTLETSVADFILTTIKQQLNFGLKSREIICIGRGKNLKYLQSLNEKHQLFDKIHTVPHPRWVMQYKRRDKLLYLDEYLKILHRVAVG